MKRKIPIILAIPLCMSLTAFADQLSNQRVKVIGQYVNDLGKAKTQEILSLFAEGAVLHTDSQGQVNAKKFFSTFLPKLTKASASLGAIYKNPQLKNQYLAHFRLSYVMKGGRSGGGQFADRFVFKKNTAKLKQVDMFEKVYNP